MQTLRWKKTRSLLLALLLMAAVVLTGCGSKEPEQTEPDTTNETKPVETPAEEAKSPLAAAWLIPGIFALYAGLKRRNN